MWVGRGLLLLGVIVAKLGHSQDVSETTTEGLFTIEEGVSETTEEVVKVERKKLSERVLEFLEHFKQPNPEGIPGADILDPCPVPDRSQSLTLGTLYFTKNALYGTKKFRIEYLNADIENMEIHGAMVVDKLQTRGRYSYMTSPFMWFNRAEGPYIGDFTGVRITARATLGVEQNGKLRAQDINMNLTYETVNLNFENLGFLSNMIQGVSSILFESTKPYLLKEAHDKLRADINAKLEEVTGDIQFPNTLTPLDMVIVDARNKMQDIGLDPYKLEDYNITAGVFSVSLSHTWIKGISTFYRIGNVTIKMENNTAVAGFEVGSKKIEGTTQWYLSAAAGMVTISGTASFSVEYINGRIIVEQPLDTRRKPELKEFRLELGNIQTRCDGGGIVDYIIELVVNILPNLVRYQIMDGMRSSLKLKLQEELNGIDVEEIIRRELPKIDQIKETEFKLSSLRVMPKYDDDEFFNF